MSAANMVPVEGKAVDASIIERVMLVGDLSKLQASERVSYYIAVCRSVGLNPLTRPFDYISLNGKLTLYALKNCTDQLRNLHGVSVKGIRRETIDGVHVVTAHVSTKDGRSDEDVGAVSINGLKGEALANALMKATTKAKRRATLSICGLSFVDESEIESIADAHRITVTEDGEILEPKKLPRRVPEAPNTPHPETRDAVAIRKDFERRIGDVVNQSGTKADLKVIGLEIAKSGLDSEARDHLEQVYVLALEAIESRLQESRS